MQRLRADGYTHDQIRQALADVGVCVDVSTVRREIARSGLRQAETKVERCGAPPVPCSTPVAPTGVSEPVSNDPRSGKDIAEAFVRNRITNPLLRSQEPR